MIKNLRYVCFSLLFSSFAAMAVSSPSAMIESSSKQILAALDKNQSSLKSNPAIVHRLVRQYLLPKVDTYGMARSVVGRNAWVKASSSQRKQFTSAFIRLVIRTYSVALRDYDDETIKVYPARGGFAGKRFVRIKSVVIKKSGRKIPLSYSLVRKGSGWKVYDMSVEGVSILQSFRNQFASELADGNMSQLILKLNQGGSKKR